MDELEQLDTATGLKQKEQLLDRSLLDLKHLFRTYESAKSIANQFGESLENEQTTHRSLEMQLEAFNIATKGSFADEISLESWRYKVPDKNVPGGREIAWYEKAWISIQQILEKIWQAIKNAFWTVYKYLSDVIGVYSNGIERIAASIDKMKPVIDDLAWNRVAPSEREFKLRRHIQYLQFGGQVDADELNSALLKTIVAFHKTNKLYLDYVNKINIQLEELTDKMLKLDDDNVKDFTSQVFRLADLPREMDERFSEVIRDVRHTETPGNLQISYTKARINEDTHITTSLPKIRFSYYDKKYSVDADQSIEVPRPQQLKTLLGTLESYVNSTREFETKLEKSTNKAKEVFETQDRYLKRDDIHKKLEKLRSENERALKIFLSFFNINQPSDLRHSLHYQFSIARSIAIYIKKSIQAYEKGAS